MGVTRTGSPIAFKHHGCHHIPLPRATQHLCGCFSFTDITTPASSSIKMLHPDFLSYPASTVNIQGEWNCITRAPWSWAGQEAWWILKAALPFCRQWSRLLSTMTPPSPGQHCCFCFDKPDQLLSFYCIQNSKSCRGKAAEKSTGPERAALQSGLPYSSHAVRRQEPPLFPGGNQILLEIFLSDITIYRVLALLITFVSDLYMSTWPINFIRG